jgi:hypothetical protein
MEINITSMAKAWISGNIPNHGLLLIGNIDSSYLKKFWSSDHSNEFLRPKLEVVHKINQPPIINNNLSFFYMSEDEPADIFLNAKYYPNDGIFLDTDEGDQLSLFLHNNKSWEPVIPSTEYEFANFKIVCMLESRITIIPNKDYYGINYLSFMAIDVVGEFINHDMIVDIQAVNDRPILNSAYDWIINSNNNNNSTVQIDKDGHNIKIYQNSEVDLIVTAFDVDSSTLYFEIHDYDILGINMEEHEFEKIIELDKWSGGLYIRTTNDCVGTFKLNITVDDRYLEDWRIFTFEVLNINDDPVLVNVNGISINNHKAEIRKPAAVQDQKFVISVEARDPDISVGIFNQLWFFAASYDEDTLVMDEGRRLKCIHDFSIVPDNDDAMRGYILINITIQDQLTNRPDDWAEIREC